MVWAWRTEEEEDKNYFVYYWIVNSCISDFIHQTIPYTQAGARAGAGAGAGAGAVIVIVIVNVIVKHAGADISPDLILTAEA